MEHFTMPYFDLSRNGGVLLASSRTIYNGRTLIMPLTLKGQRDGVNNPLDCGFWFDNFGRLCLVTYTFSSATNCYTLIAFEQDGTSFVVANNDCAANIRMRLDRPALAHEIITLATP